MNVHLLISVMEHDETGKITYRTHVITPALSVVDFIIQNPHIVILNTHKLSVLEYKKLEKYDGVIYH